MRSPPGLRITFLKLLNSLRLPFIHSLITLKHKGNHPCVSKRGKVEFQFVPAE